MKKLLGILALAGLLAQAGPASAATVDLTEHFASGATFTGTLTFSDNYDEFQAVTGVLSGGSYGTQSINWTWWLGTGQTSVARDLDGDPTTYEDWAMNGSPPGDWTLYLGLSWSAPGGVFQLALTPATDIYYAGINQTDAAVSYSLSTVPESGTLAMMMAGLGALALVRRRAKR
ncbi:MAG: PEP-CTERM sorting domain-containing protein [Betaproteobacteria bacterium]